MLGDGPALLGMPDTELQGILKIKHEVVGGQQAERKFDSQTIKPSGAQNCKESTDQDIRSDNAGVINANLNMPDYFRSSTDREAEKWVSQVLMQRIHNEFSDFFFRNWVF